MGFDLSDLQALMGGSFEEPTGESGGVWVVSPDGLIDDAMLRLIGKGRVVADALGGYVYLLAGCNGAGADTEGAIRAGADKVLTAGGMPTVNELADFFRERQPQAVLLPRSRLGKALGPGLAQALGGSLCPYAADLAVDPIYQRIVAHQPILDDAARMQVILLAAPAVAVMETALLPAAFNEPWRQGEVGDTQLMWSEPPSHEMVDRPARPITLKTSPVVVVAGQGLTDDAGFAAAMELADALIALGVDGDTSFMMGVAEAGCLVAAQADAGAPIVPFADYNVVGDPAEFARAFAKAARG